MNISTEKWLSPPKWAKILGIDPDKITALIRTGEIKACNLAVSKVGRPRYRISEAEMRAFLERRSSSAPPPATRRRSKKASQKYYS